MKAILFAVMTMLGAAGLAACDDRTNPDGSSRGASGDTTEDRKANRSGQ